MGIEIILVVLVSICVVLWLTHLSQRVSELKSSIERRSSVTDEIHSLALRAEHEQTKTVAEIVALLRQLAADTDEIKKSLPKRNAKGQFTKKG